MITFCEQAHIICKFILSYLWKQYIAIKVHNIANIAIIIHIFYSSI